MLSLQVSLRHSMLEKQVMPLQELRPTRDFLQMHLQEQEILLVHEWRISQETHLVKVLTPTAFFYKEAKMQKQYQERTTLRAWGVLRRALQVSQPGYFALTWRHEHKPQVTCCKGFCSKEGPHYCFEQSARNPLEHDQVQKALGKLSRSCLRTSNNQPWFTSLNTPWGFLARAVLRWLSGGLCHTRKCQLKDIVWEDKVWFTFAQQRLAPETFSKKRKGERKPVPSLVPGSCERLVLRNSRILCQKHRGARTAYYLGVPKAWENMMRNWIAMQPKGAKKFVSSNSQKY